MAWLSYLFLRHALHRENKIMYKDIVLATFKIACGRWGGSMLIDLWRFGEVAFKECFNKHFHKDLDFYIQYMITLNSLKSYFEWHYKKKGACQRCPSRKMIHPTMLSFSRIPTMDYKSFQHSKIKIFDFKPRQSTASFSGVTPTCSHLISSEILTLSWALLTNYMSFDEVPLRQNQSYWALLPWGRISDCCP